MVENSPFEYRPKLMPAVEPEPTGEWPFGKIYFLGSELSVGPRAGLLTKTQLTLATVATFGYTNRQIGGLRGIDDSASTVGTLLTRANKRLDVSGRNTILPRLLAEQVLTLEVVGDAELHQIEEEDRKLLSAIMHGLGRKDISKQFSMSESDIRDQIDVIGSYTGLSVVTTQITAGIVTGQLDIGTEFASANELV